MLAVGADHLRPHRQRAPAGARRRPPRAAHGAALRHEPRARRDARPGEHGARRGAPRERGVRQPGGGAAARRRRAACAIRAARASPARCTARTSASRSGCRTTAQPAGLGTDTLPGSEALYLPLKGAQAVLGVLGVLPANPRRVLLPEQFHLLETFAGQIALALERAQLAERAQRASIDAETEGLRNALLASISHDLRTPLAVIAGASSSLAERGEQLPAPERAALARSIYEQSRQMADLVAKVLEMTRLEAGGIALERDWHALAEIVGSVLRRLRRAARRAPGARRRWRPTCRWRAWTPRSSSRCSPTCWRTRPSTRRPGTAITLRAALEGGEFLVSVEDDGPGLPPGDPEQLFAKFQRGAAEGAIGGVGLGLAICRAIVRPARRAHLGGAPARRAVPRSASPCRSRKRRRCPRSRRERAARHDPGGGGRAGDPALPALFARRRGLSRGGGRHRRARRDRGGHAQARPRDRRPRAAGHRRRGGDPAHPRLVADADRGAVGAHARAGQGRGAGRRRRRLRHQALRRRRAAGAGARRAAPCRAHRRQRCHRVALRRGRGRPRAPPRHARGTRSAPDAARVPPAAMPRRSTWAWWSRTGSC